MRRFFSILLIVVPIISILVYFRVDIGKLLLSGSDVVVEPLPPELSIEGLDLVDSDGKTVLKGNNEFIKPNSSGFIKAKIKNDGGPAEDVVINFKFLNPEDDTAKMHCLPKLNKLQEGEQLKEPKNLDFGESSLKKKLENGTTELQTEIKVGKVTSRYVCIEVELSVENKEADQLDVKDSEHYVLLVYDP